LDGGVGDAGAGRAGEVLCLGDGVLDCGDLVGEGVDCAGIVVRDVVELVGAVALACERVVEDLTCGAPPARLRLVG
jgi:hypothetical protein